MEPTHEQIAVAAYFIWARRTFIQGRAYDAYTGATALTDWYQGRESLL